MVDPYCYKLILSYNGTAYKGWQRQPDGISIQQTIEDVLRRLFHDPDLVLTGCSRTDTGVHALAFAASFHAKDFISSEKLKFLINKQLPHDIAILSAENVLPPWNANEAVKGKAYVYAVLAQEHALFLKDACWLWTEPDPDWNKVRRCLELFKGTHDFRSFAGHLTGVSTTERTVCRAELYDFGPVHCFYFAGSGFLHKMIRRITGTLHEAAYGRCAEEEILHALQDPSYRACDVVAPAQGLYLKKVFFEENEWQADSLKNPPFAGIC